MGDVFSTPDGDDAPEQRHGGAAEVVISLDRPTVVLSPEDLVGAAVASDAGCRPWTPSQPSMAEAAVEFRNGTGERLVASWVDFQGEPVEYARLDPGHAFHQRTYIGHRWLFRPEEARKGSCVEAGGPRRHPCLGASGSLWFTRVLFTEEDTSALTSLRALGRGRRRMFDRRLAATGCGWVTHGCAHLFAARLGETSGKVVEVQVNPEFGEDEARVAAERYARALGKLPAFLLRDVDSLWVHRGRECFGGGNRNVLVHTEMAEAYTRDEVLEEALVHEATHTSMDADHLHSPGWRSAMERDGVAVSAYARDHPAREDLAETMGPYLAVAHRAHRLPPEQVQRVRSALPHRMAYLDGLHLSMDILR